MGIRVLTKLQWTLKCLVLLGILTAVRVGTQWTSLPSVTPSALKFGMGTYVGNSLFHLRQGQHYGYNIETDVWTTLANRPSVADRNQAHYAAINGDKTLAVGGGSPVVDLVHAYTPALDTWQTKARMPNVRFRGGSTSSGSQVWCVAGANGGSAMQGNRQYTVSSDTWTILAVFPYVVRFLGLGYYDGTVLAVSGDVVPSKQTHAYIVDSDVWTTKTSAPTTHNHGDRSTSLQMFEGAVYVVGGAAPSQFSFHKYAVATDTWTSLDDTPFSCANCVSAVYASFFVIASFFGTAKYTLSSQPSPAGASSDPHLRDFNGHYFLLDCKAGVYNLFSSSELQVNIVLDNPPDLPPHWHSVITLVAIKLHSGESELRFTINTEGKVQSDNVASAQAVPTGDSVQFLFDGVLVTAGVGLRLTTLTYSLQVFPQRLSWTSTHVTKYLDVLIHPANVCAHGILGQTLGNPYLLPPSSVKSEITNPFDYLQGTEEDYLVRSGDIFGDDFAFSLYHPRD